MEPPVVAAVISSTTALGVAVIGVLATGIAQTRATERAHANALDLFDRQETARAATEDRAAVERLRLAHLADKRALYLRMPVLVSEYDDARRNRNKAVSMEATAEALGASPDRLDGLIGDSRDAFGAEIEVLRQMVAATETLRIMAPMPVADAASAWMEAVTNDERSDRNEMWDEYLRVVRADLGTDLGADGELPKSDPPDDPET